MGITCQYCDRLKGRNTNKSKKRKSLKPNQFNSDNDFPHEQTQLDEDESKSNSDHSSSKSDKKEKKTTFQKNKEEEKFWLSQKFDNPLVSTKTCEVEKYYKTLNLINNEDIISSYKVKQTQIGLLRNMTKCEKKENYNDKIKKVIKEANIQKSLDHPSILKIFEIYDTPKCYYIISEINDGRKLFDEINDIGPFPEKIAANLLYQLLNVVNYLHRNKGIIHTRINPGTIIVNTYDDENEYYDIKLTNYHDCILIDNKDRTPSTSPLFEKFEVDLVDVDYEQKKGHLNDITVFDYFGISSIDRFFVAPETIIDDKDKDNYDEQCDIYSIGVIGYYIITGKIPYCGGTDDPKKEILGSKKLNEFNDPLFENISYQGKNLIKSMLNKNPKYRITAEKALKSNWFISLETKKTLRVPNIDYRNILINIENYKRPHKLYEITLSFLVHNIPDIDEIRNINKVYSNFNSTFDGKMNFNQIKEGFENYLNTRTSEGKSNFEAKIQDIFNLLDRNKNNYIDYEEFARGGIDKKLFREDEVLKFAFNYMDENSSGCIDPYDLKELLSTNQDDFERELMDIKNDIPNKNDNDGIILDFELFKTIMLKHLGV